MMTEKQQRAVDFGEGNVLVSASAGSGKTCVMVNRIIRLIAEGKANVDEILCVTFTVLAASEMKQKIAAAITERIRTADAEESERLSRQLDMLPTANISTVHSFCKNLIKEFFYEAGVDPSFSVVSDSEREKLVKRAIDRYFDEMYESGDEKLELLLPVFFKRRSDAALKNLVVSVFNGIMTEPDPFKILDDGELYYTEEGVGKIYDELAAELKAELKRFADYAEGYAAEFAGFSEYENYVALVINGLNFAAEGKTPAEITDRLADALPRRPGKKKTDDEKILRAEAAFKEFADEYGEFRRKKMKEYDLNDFDEELAFAADGLEIYRAFCGVVKGFAAAFAEEKREENCVDFSDFEHFALKVLQNEAIRNEVRARFKFVFTDEYQDTSGVQEYLLRAVSNDNLFMVGDVKQNIYDFRGCNPLIFAEKRKLYEETGEGEVIDLDKNFRSTNAVISAVNRVFSGSMTQKCGNVDYRANQMIFGADYPEDEGEIGFYAVKKRVDKGNLPRGVYGVVKHLETMNDGGFFAEGAFIAKMILDIYGKEIFVGKDGKKKKIEFGDIAILLRNANASGDAYAKELIAAGIPVSANSKKSIGEYAEIAFLIDFLKLVGCFNQDIPLASVLKSNIGGVSDAELYAIRKFTPRGSFVDAYGTYIREKGADDPLAEKLRKFDRYMEKIRLIASFTSCDELLSLVIRENGIDVGLLSSRMGEFKMARVNAFIRAAGAKKQTVDEFLSGIDETVKALTVAYDDENAVKIMSVHASKGLEYPVVILAGAFKEYNDRDKSGNFIYDRKYGVAIAHYDTMTMVVRKTAFLAFLKKKLLKRSREEEMRILYVALTRARNDLYVVGEYGKTCPNFKKTHFEGDIYSVKRPFDFFAENDFPFVDAGEWDERKQAERSLRKVFIGECDEELASYIAANLDFKYESADEFLSVKRSVTSAAHFEEEGAPAFERKPLFEEPSEEFFDLPFDVSADSVGSPSAADSAGAGSADSADPDILGAGVLGAGAVDEEKKREDVGTAYHAFLEKCDFGKDAESEIKRLIDGLLLPKEQIALLDRNKLGRILKMKIFRSIDGWPLYREQPFTAYMPATLIGEENSGSGEILVQGIIDLLCVKGDEALVIDYKYTGEWRDDVLVKRYRKQLELYVYAVEKVLKKKVTGVYLVNIKADKVISVDLKNKF